MTELTHTLIARPATCRPAAQRRGSVLVAVMVITILTSIIAASLLFRIRAESSAAGGTGQAEQARATALSGLKKALMILEESPHDIVMWYDNEDMFRNQFVCDDGTTQWYFTIFAANEFEDQEVRYGVTGLGGRVNINFADEATLMRLPQMTRQLAHTLIDYRDADNEPMDEGLEDQQLDEGSGRTYIVKNGPLATLEELLLVKGFDGTIVYGEDANFNGMLDPNEDDEDEHFPPDDGNGELSKGLRGCAVTVTYGQDKNKDGQRRYNLNSDSSAASKAGLSSQTQEFVKLYRGEGNTFKHPSQLLKMRYRLENTVYEEESSGRSSRGRSSRGGRGMRGPPGRRGAPGGSTRRVKYAAGSWIESGVDGDDLAKVMDKLTTASGGILTGAVNVNTASLEALTAVGLDVDVARKIVEERHELTGEYVEVDEERKEGRTTTAWLYVEGLVDDEVFKAVAPKLCARGYQYHVQCVGFGWPGGRYCVIEAVVDLSSGKPSVTYLRDITRLGLPFKIDLEAELGL